MEVETDYSWKATIGDIPFFNWSMIMGGRVRDFIHPQNAIIFLKNEIRP